MKCKYTFKIRGQIKVACLQPIQARGMTFEFLQEGGRLTGICVIVRADKPEDLPVVVPSPRPGIKADIFVPAPWFPFVKREVRAIEALLSPFGLHEIDLNRFLTQWIPENDNEKTLIKLNDFATDYGHADLERMPPLPFDILARSVIAADEAAEVEIQLTFYRKGRMDFFEKRFIEAIYDFYFFLESMFGKGKTKNKAVEDSFKQSEELISAIVQIMADPEKNLIPKPDDIEAFLKKYKAMSTEDIIEHIVGLRGFLHHHTAKRKDIWHPEDHQKYELEAHLLQAISFHIAIKMSLYYIYKKHVMEEYARKYGIE